MAVQIKQPFEMFFNKDGSPLNNGNIYIGTAGLNPETNPISIFSDPSMTIPVAQPLKTTNGYISINGSARDIFAQGDYSITVKDKNGLLMYHSLTNNTDNTIIGTIAVLRTTVYSGQQIISVTGYYTAADNIGVREYYWDATSIEADNGGTIIQCTGIGTGRWKMKYSGDVNVKWFGAKGDGVTDDITAIKATVAYADGRKILAPFGTYLLSSTLSYIGDVNIDFNNSTITTSATTAFLFEGSLKATTSAVSYTDSTDKNTIIVVDSTGFVVGDIINIVSADLFDTSRAYYFKGGNAIVTKISGNKIYFNLTSLGYNMSTSIVVKAYKPSQVNISNIGLLNSSLALSVSLYGIRCRFCTYSTISNVVTDVFQNHIVFERSVAITIKDSETRRAKYTTEDAWDGYGISIESSTNAMINNTNTNSGQHGINIGGNEVNYNISIENSSIKAEVWSLGLGYHENTMRSSVENCEIFGATIAGQASFYNCSFVLPEGLISHLSIVLAMGESETKPSYSFEKCDFRNIPCKVMDYYQIGSATRKYVGKIFFSNCNNINITTSVKELTTIAKIAEIDSIDIENTIGFVVTIADIVDRISISNSSATANANIISQVIANAVYQPIRQITLDNVSIPSRFNVIKLDLLTNLFITNLKYSGVTYGNGQIVLNNVTNVIASNIDTSEFERGLTMTAIASMRISDSNIVYFGTLAAMVAACTVIYSRGTTINTEKVDLWTDGATKYKVKLTAGAFVITAT